MNTCSLSDLGLNSGENAAKQELPQNDQAVVLYHPPTQHHQQVQPDHFGSHPTLVPIPTNYTFDMTVQPEQSVVFSQNKLFIRLGAKMTFSVSYREQVRNESLFLRAMIVFSKPAEMHLPVKRCNNHRTGGNASSAIALASIIRINNPKALYCGFEDGETFGDRLSVVMPLENGNFDENGHKTQMISCEFLCQSSCSSGINRRPTTVVFTLENANGKLLGKKTQEFKVCSCPKRDSEREILERKRKSEADVPHPRGKKPKYERPGMMQQQKQNIKIEPKSESESDSNNEQSHNGSHPMSLITVNIPTELVSAFLENGYNLLAGKLRKTNDVHTKNAYENSMKDIEKLQQKFDRN